MTPAHREAPPIPPRDESSLAQARAPWPLVAAFLAWLGTLPIAAFVFILGVATDAPETQDSAVVISALALVGIWGTLAVQLVRWWRQGRGNLWTAPLLWLGALMFFPVLFFSAYRRVASCREQVTARYCVHCGTPLVANARFCASCGRPTA